MKDATEKDMKDAAYYSLGKGVAVVTDWHPDGLPRFTSWVEVNSQPLRMPQGGVITYANRQEAMFAGKCTAKKLARN